MLSGEMMDEIDFGKIDFSKTDIKQIEKNVKEEKAKWAYLKDFGFEPSLDKNRYVSEEREIQRGYTRFFERGLDNNYPRLELSISDVPSPQMMHVVIVSAPWKKEYHFSTGTPISVEEIPEVIKNYFENFKNIKRTEREQDLQTLGFL
jgi:hypothetical protein